MSDKEEMASDGGLNVTLTLRLLMHGKVVPIIAQLLQFAPFVYMSSSTVLK